MPNVHDFYKSSTLKGDDLVGKPPVVVTIERVDVEDFGEDRKLVARFAHTTRKLPLNWTNAMMLATIAGSDDSDDWVGLQIRLMPCRVLYRGNPVNSIRIEPAHDVEAFGPAPTTRPVPAQKPARSNDPFGASDSDIPF